MFKKNNIALTVSTLISVGVLTACTSPNTARFSEAQETNKETAEKHFQLQRDMEFNRQRGRIGNVIDDRHYVNIGSMYVEKERKVQLPLSFRNQISFTSRREMTQQEFTSELFRDTNILVEFTPSSARAERNQSQNSFLADSSGVISLGVNQGGSRNQGGSSNQPQRKIKPLSFEGSFENFLDYVGVLHDLKWSYDERSGKVFFFDTAIRTFYVYEQNVDVSASNSITTSASGDADGASAGNTQSISFSSSESPWNDIENTINNLLSQDGKVSFNRRQGKIIVEDNDFVLSKIDAYIENVNKAATRQVAGRIDVLNVKLSDSQNFGVNVNYINDALRNNLLGSFAGSLNLGGSIDGGGFGGNAMSIQNDSGLRGLVGFLNTMGTVNLSASADFNTLNNNATSFQVTSNEEYIKRYQAQTNTLGSSDTFTVETGTIKDGITMTVTPRIVGDQVRVDFSMSLSTNDGFNPNSPVPQLQLPRTSNKNFNQTIISDNGETRVLMAYTKDSGDTSTQGPGTSRLWFLGGSERFSSEKEVILITSTVYFDVL